MSPCRAVSFRVFRVVSFRVFRVVSCHVISCRFVSYCVIWCRVVSLHVILCRFASFCVVSFHVVSCHFVSCRDVSRAFILVCHELPPSSSTSTPRLEGVAEREREDYLDEVVSSTFCLPFSFLFASSMHLFSFFFPYLLR